MVITAENFFFKSIYKQKEVAWHCT